MYILILLIWYEYYYKINKLKIYKHLIYYGYDFMSKTKTSKYYTVLSSIYTEWS
jgi:hypothetical protein